MSGHATSLRLEVEEWLYQEAELLDDHLYREWLALLHDDIDYRAPMRVNAKRGHPSFDERMFLFEENIHSLTMRVRRLETDVAWAEDPPSRTRRLVGNVRAEQRPEAGTPDIAVRSNLLLYRNRGDDAGHDLLAAERHDCLRRTHDGLVLVTRLIMLDQVVVGTKNLGIFF